MRYSTEKKRKKKTNETNNSTQKRMSIYFWVNFALAWATSLSWPTERGKTKCDLWMQRHLSESGERHYFNLTTPLITFASVDELNIICPKLDTIQFQITLLATKSLLLDNDLNLRWLFAIFTFSPKRLNTLRVINVKGFNLRANYSKLNSYLDSFEVSMVNVKFDFYKKGTLVTRDQCRREFFDAKRDNYFGGLKSLHLIANVDYSTSVCPYVFANAILSDLCLQSISNSFIFKNRLAFLPLAANDSNVDLNLKHFVYVQLTLAYDVLTHALLNAHVFKRVKVMYFSGTIYAIDADLFAHFSDLKLVIMSVENFRDFFHAGTAWMSSLNAGVSVDLANKIEFASKRKRSLQLQLFARSSPVYSKYAYPDTDICLFKAFPHRQLVYPSIILGKRVKCSCTILWLQKYALYYLDARTMEYFDPSYKSQPAEFANFTARYCIQENSANTCNFTHLFAKCHDPKNATVAQAWVKCKNFNSFALSF